MKLSSNPESPNYHQIVHYVEAVFVDGIEMKSCVELDFGKNEAEVYTQPLRHENGNMVTHSIAGKIEIKWRETITPTFFEHLKADWEAKYVEIP